ncbi:lipoprotein-anchoring transpeptidase ErfK/SrfK [Nakamurella sp. UYEF19]|uniref:L,D-transpeptidase n=1 Tax=Nakamurella sp. UYEF19 TaxID=1756392 RepID=UPI00339140AC
MVHMQVVGRTERSASTGRLRLVALMVALGVAATACTSAAGSAQPATVTVGSTVTAAPAGSTAVTVPAGTGAASSAPASSAPASSGSTSSSGAASSAPVSSPPSSSAPSSSAIALPVAKISASPAFGAKTVGPADPLKISVAQGKITALTLTSPSGKVLKGAISADGSSWSLGEVLGYGKTYKAAGTATGTDGKVVPIAGSFTTVTPTSKVRTTISPGDGKTVGVATSVIVSFGVEPADRAAIAKRIFITTTPKVTGAWVWIQHDGGEWALDFRTQSYWPENTKVHVEADVYGMKFTNGAYGTGDVTSDFTIGRNQVVKADVNSHDLLVFQDGKQVAAYPASYGKGDTPDKVTRSGVHVVNDMNETKLMSNPKYGYTNVLEHWAVRISDNGEFIHANPNTVGDQGNTNVSHGCVNLSLANAEAYFKSTLLGDPVEVTGTSINLSASDGDLFDWTYSWSQWKNLAVKTGDTA